MNEGFYSWSGLRYFLFEWILSTKDVEPVAYVISANIRRRHLDAAQKRELIAACQQPTHLNLLASKAE
jgi:hypothetical protein